ncbi:RNA polymerase sigma factor [Sinorhizobium numidicum]|uniref:RNA polymerase sigma factor n=1 Tax=Sinorhizobium numidicum TaxID=680248 RepID=A0ABY8CXU7_9HYPH|nr:RNA polymerase sigma factor [Sinorhizobium numidicum]WEX76267.1 RNA polymerase sigma factor [Sinorhizobium numidicum]WEX82927.1 RNA polymerase sigma factor [Sinorhizobium numidicum]
MSHGRNGPDMSAGAEAPAPDAFEEDVLALVPALRRYSRSLVRSDPDGEDLLQDCVEKVLARRAQWRGVNLRAWAFTIMINLYRNRHRHSAQHPEVEFDDALGLVAEEADTDPLERLRLERALARLSADNRAVLMLVVIEGYRYQDVAEMMAIPIGTVMSRLSRARRQLAEAMKDDNVIALRRPK